MMSFQIVRAEETRRTETPNATMTTLSSPSVSGASDTSLWIVEMEAGATGPVYAMENEQHWHVIDGTLQCEIDGTTHVLQPGDTLRIDGGIARQFCAITSVRIVVTGRSADHAITFEGAPPVVPGWIS